MSDWKLAHHGMTFASWWKRQEMEFDRVRFFREVREAGYTGVEIGGNAETLGSARQLQSELDEHGLQIAAWGLSVTAQPYEPNIEAYEKSMAYAAEMGVRTLACCGGFLGKKRRAVFEDEYKIFAENLAAAQAHADQYGQILTFHPHVRCMAETIEETQKLLRYYPELQLCIDTGHLLNAGTDPTMMTLQYSGKVAHVHLKDYNPEDDTFGEVGHGSSGFDFAEYFRALERIGYDGWVVVERDNPPMPGIDSAKVSMDGIQAALQRL
jgi:inosose dehydratase